MAIEAQTKTDIDSAVDALLVLIETALADSKRPRLGIWWPLRSRA
jgi:hypothetical protein